MTTPEWRRDVPTAHKNEESLPGCQERPDVSLKSAGRDVQWQSLYRKEVIDVDDYLRLLEGES